MPRSSTSLAVASSGLEVVHDRAPNVAHVLLAEDLEDFRVGLAGVEDDGELEFLGEAYLLAEDLVLGGNVGGLGEEIEADLADADHLVAAEGEGLKGVVGVLVDGGLDVHGMDADAGIEGLMFSPAMAMQARVEATLVPAQRMKSTWASPGALEYLGQLAGRVLVEVGV